MPSSERADTTGASGGDDAPAAGGQTTGDLGQGADEEAEAPEAGQGADTETSAGPSDLSASDQAAGASAPSEPDMPDTDPEGPDDDQAVA